MGARHPRPEDCTTFASRPSRSRGWALGRLSVKAVAPGKDGTDLAVGGDRDGGAPARQLTSQPVRKLNPMEPDSRTLAFCPIRAAVLQAGGGGAKPGKAEAPKEGANQLAAAVADGGEARQLTDSPRTSRDRLGADGAASARQRATSTEPISAGSKPEIPAPDTRRLTRSFTS